jgi:hypothetical protein
MRNTLRADNRIMDIHDTTTEQERIFLEDWLGSDASWANDTCPSFETPDRTFRVYVEQPSFQLREDPRIARWCVYKGEIVEPVFSTECIRALTDWLGANV